MFKKAAENTVTRYLTYLIPFGALFILTGVVTDPVNVTKLLAIGSTGVSLLGIFLVFGLKHSVHRFQPFLVAILIFILLMVLSLLTSAAPITQNFYGTYGRNTGFLTYFTLVGVALAALLLQSRENFQKVLWGLQVVGVVNVLYCGWVLAFGDFVGWNNPYGNILGLFGNPNFIGAFLGIFISTLMAMVVNKEMSWTYRVASIVVGLLAFYEILQSKAIQGIVVTAVGGTVVGFYWLRSRFSAIWVTSLYVLVTSVFGVVALFGALQKGPMSFVYKRSVSLRGSYWDAAITMGNDHPLTGVGMDAYGDWYRQARSLVAATTTPGIGVTSNAAHNVVLDFFAFGGWPLLFSYVAILGFGAWAILRVTLRKREYDPIFVAMAVAWICYQLQSIISINQIGLAVWGWLLTGALLAFEYSTRDNIQVAEEKSGKQSKKKPTSVEIISPSLVGGIGLVVGLLICVPPLSADMTWRSALQSQSAEQVEKALKSSYLNPSSTQRYAEATQLFAKNNLPNQALNAARAGVQFNKNNFNAWLLLWYMPGATAAEKAEAEKNLKRLDPLNPNPTAQ
jgi:O-antigen ligase